MINYNTDHGFRYKTCQKDLYEYKSELLYAISAYSMFSHKDLIFFLAKYIDFDVDKLKDRIIFDYKDTYFKSAEKKCEDFLKEYQLCDSYSKYVNCCKQYQKYLDGEYDDICTF